MRFFKRKTQLQRLLGTVNDSLEAPIGKKLGLPDRPSDQTLKAGLIAADGLAGLTAGSAGIFAQAPRQGGEGPFVKLTSVAIFAAGYIIGAKAGRERYAQVIHVLERTSQRLDEFSSRHTTGRQDDDSRRASGGS